MAEGWEGRGGRLRELNDRLMLAERGFLDAAGLSGRAEAPYRRWLKHLVRNRCPGGQVLGCC